MRSTLSSELRDNEEEMLYGLKGDIFALLAATRLSCMTYARTKHALAYKELPERLRTEVDGHCGRSRCGATISRGDYETIRRRVISIAHRIEDDALATKPCTERRSVESLADQVDAFLKKSGGGAFAKPVWSETLGRWFCSTKAAARYMAEQTGRNVVRGHIRTSITRKNKCHGVTFSYEGPTEQAPRRTIILNGNNLPLRAVLRDGKTVHFQSRCEASRRLKDDYATDVSSTSIARALLDGQGTATIEGIQFDEVEFATDDSFDAVKPVESLFHGATTIERKPKTRRQKIRHAIIGQLALFSSQAVA